jgi:hypothetical protein
VYQVVHWVHLAQDKVQGRAVFGFPKGGKILPAEFIRKGSQVVRQLLHYWCDIWLSCSRPLRSWDRS